MGQQDNIKYTAAVMGIAFLIVLVSTSSLKNIEHSGQLSLLKHPEITTKPLTLSLVYLSMSLDKPKAEFHTKLESLAQAYATVNDLEISVQSVLVDKPDTSFVKKTLVPSYRQEIVLTFGLNVTGPGVVAVQSFEDSVPYIVSSVRGEKEAKASLKDGWAEDESKPQGSLYTGLIKHEVALYNSRIAQIYHLLNKLDIEGIRQVKKQLKQENFNKSLYVMLNELNSRLSLRQEEYFQWDYKLGVYAPICIPSLFPLGAALYYRFFVKSKVQKQKTE